MDRFVEKKPKLVRTHNTEKATSSSESDIDNEATCSTKRNFRKEWCIQFKCLEERNGTAYCFACEKPLMNHISKLKLHEQRARHLHNINKKKGQIRIDSFVSEEKKTLEKQVRNAELNLVMFVITHNLPFILMDFLPRLLAVCCTDSKIAQSLKCGRTKASQLADVLGKESLNRIVSDLRSNKFSLIVDETTDTSTRKSLVLVVRYFDRLLNTIRDRFLSLVELKKSDANSIYLAIKNFFEMHNVPLSNLIGLATDGANTMAGELNGLKTKLKNDTNIFYIKCTCHSLHLCARYACKELSDDVESLCRNIYKFFSHSPKRINEFKEFQDLCGVKPHKILGTSFTRWLALESVIVRINEQWEALRLYFLSSCLEVNGVKAEKLANTMSDPELKVYMLFLGYILKIINTLNKEFQSEKVRLPFLYIQIEAYFKVILSNFMHNDYVRNVGCLQNFDLYDTTKYLNPKEIFIGSKAEAFIESDKFTDSQKIAIKKNILKFYLELLKQIQGRFDFDREDLKNLSTIAPEKVLSDTETSIIPLINNFSYLINCDEDAIVTQWKLLRLQNLNLTSDMDVSTFWEKVGSHRNGMNEKSFADLINFVYDLMSLPHSSAAAERKFFELSLIKTKLRNKLEYASINNIMLAKELLSKNPGPHYIWSVKDIGWH